jgi:hypothetical protein
VEYDIKKQGDARPARKAGGGGEIPFRSSGGADCGASGPNPYGPMFPAVANPTSGPQGEAFVADWTNERTVYHLPYNSYLPVVQENNLSVGNFFITH